MRNKYPGVCADCGLLVASNEGYFERKAGRFHVRCMKCVVEGKMVKGHPLSDEQIQYLSSISGTGRRT